MNINFKYYHEEKDKEITKTEKEIIQKYIYDENNNENVLENEEIIMALSPKRQNLFNWYPFNKEASLLEVQANLGEITQVFINKLKKVTVIEQSKQKAEAIGKKYENVDNLEVIAGEIEDISLEEKYDYIVIYNPNILQFAKKM